MDYFKLLLCLAALVSTTYAHGFFKSPPPVTYAYHQQPYSVGTAYVGKALFVSPPQPVYKAVPIVKTIAVAPPPPTIIRTPVYVHLPPPPPPPPTIVKVPVYIHAAPLPPPPPSAIVHSYSGPVAPILPPPIVHKTFIPHLPPPPPPPQFISYHQPTPVVKAVLPGWHHHDLHHHDVHHHDVHHHDLHHHHEQHVPVGPALPPHPVSVEANLLKSFQSYGPPATAYGPPSAPAW